MLAGPERAGSTAVKLSEKVKGICNHVLLASKGEAGGWPVVLAVLVAGIARRCIHSRANNIE